MTTDNDGWIEWRGGPCPIPDAKAGEFCIRNVYNKSQVEGVCEVDAIDLNWVRQSRYSLQNIIAYRIHKPAPDYRALLAMAVEALKETRDDLNMRATNNVVPVGITVWNNINDTLAAIEKAVK